MQKTLKKDKKMINSFEEDIIEDKDLVKFLNEILEKYDYSYKTARKIKRDIKEFS